MRGGTLTIVQRIDITVDNFNPPAPGGAGRQFVSTISSAFTFQSTRPVRGGTVADGTIRAVWIFQSTRPVRGGTRPGRFPASESLFQSTRPVRGGTLSPIREYLTSKISIHPPRAGRDLRLIGLMGSV